MKLLTLNFLTCARKTCKSAPAAFPLHPHDAELEQIESDMNPTFLTNMLPRLDWSAMRTVANELGLAGGLPEDLPEPGAFGGEGETEGGMEGVEGEGEKVEGGKVLKDLHVFLMETSMQNGKLRCGNCGHEYAVREGIANFLLPSHLV